MQQEMWATEKPRQERDWLWEAILRECGIDPEVVTDSARGAYNRAVKSIRDVGGTPNDVRARGLAYRKAFPSARLTPPALARHWAELAPARENVLVPNQVRRCPACQKLTFDCVCP